MSEITETAEEGKTLEAKPTVEKFNEVTNKWINLTVKSFNLESIKKNFQHVLPNESVDELENAYIQAHDYVDTELRTKVEEVKEKYNLNEKLQYFDRLIAEAKDRSPVEKRFRPTSKQFFGSILCDAQEKKKNQLQKEFQNLKAENELLTEELLLKKKELKEEIESIHTELQDAKKAFDLASDMSSDMVELSNRLDVANI
ncbi:hypothetical protein BY458DRAFT_496108 [Sporodiniella umbellata]|nr:hypothetical protein BY458DRAFT_496108 [Sporodiniella umbellata]